MKKISYIFVKTMIWWSNTFVQQCTRIGQVSTRLQNRLEIANFEVFSPEKLQKLKLLIVKSLFARY